MATFTTANSVGAKEQLADINWIVSFQSNLSKQTMWTQGNSKRKDVDNPDPSLIYQEGATTIPKGSTSK